MSHRTIDSPDVLVLGAGGILGEAWMSGLLAGLEQSAGFDLRRTPALVGTSAGSIVAARLAAGQRPRRPASTAGRRASARSRQGFAAASVPAPPLVGALGRVASAAGAPVAALTLAAGSPAGARLRAAVLSRAGASGRRDLSLLGREMGRLGAHFDGRLRVVCVDRVSGRRVVFGAPRSPPAAVADAVTASCSIPWVFDPVEIAGREYVDGGAWSLTNLDAAPVAPGGDVLCLNPTGTLGGALPAPLGALRGAARAGAGIEALVLRRRGARVRTIAPDSQASGVMGHNLMDPRRAAAVLSAGFAQGLALGDT